jgi:hypothetical protein
MHEVSPELAAKYTVYGRLIQIMTSIRRHVQAPRRPHPARVDLLEARDDMLRDIGLLDGPDVALRRSELVLPSERAR